MSMSEISKELIDWLNKSRGTFSCSRDTVCTLLTALRGLERTLREHPIDSSPGTLLREAINKQLAKYQFRPTLLATGAHSVPVGWLPPSSNDSNEIEATMVRWVCDLHNERMLSRVRECLCLKWFMARSDNQECCSTRCRQKKWGKTEKGRQAGKQASRESYNRTNREPHIKRINNAIERWNRLSAVFRKKTDWKEWVANAASVEKVFITRAVNKEEVIPPISS
jgi:hypothetical protein